jgi:murein L,D-transpeptidase YcbB/YkuD
MFAMNRSALFGISFLGWILSAPIEGFPVVDSSRVAQHSLEMIASPEKDETLKGGAYPGEDATHTAATAVEAGLTEISQDSIDIEEIAGSVEESCPEDTSYLQLESALAQYRNLKDQGGWPSVPDGPTMRKGDSGPRVAALRNRLLISGDLEQVNQQRSDLFDDEMVLAVRRFQERHGRTVDGIVGRNTLMDLNVSVEQRVRQIEVNVERWQQLPCELGERFIMVNTASFQLEVVEKGQRLTKMKVVAGRRSRRTPEVSSALTYLVINPYWHIPHRIAKRDILPKIQEDPHYLIRQNILVFENWESDAPEIDARSVDWSKMTEKAFSFKLRQEPGPTNALGRFKFVFPSQFPVCLHDTPVRSLFQKTQRDFSSGCVRVEKPIELACLLLKSEPKWTRDKILDTLHSGETQVIWLSEKIPVHLSYWTAWVDERGTIHFRDDIYGRDKSLESLFSKSPPSSQLAN